RRGNKALKRALFLSAFAALRDPLSRAYYTRKMIDEYVYGAVSENLSVPAM
ncbi:TPA: IS110 family transposase, partial [Escherichia coli]|nr:IS110 family transposase [Escherichia coli]